MRQKYAITAASIAPWIEQYPSIKTYLNAINNYKEETAVYVWYFCDGHHKIRYDLLDKLQMLRRQGYLRVVIIADDLKDLEIHDLGALLNSTQHTNCYINKVIGAE